MKRREVSVQKKIVGIMLLCFFIPFLLQIFLNRVVITRLVQDKILNVEYSNLENSALHISSVLQSQLDFADYYRKDSKIAEAVSDLDRASEDEKYRYQQNIQRRFIYDNNIERYKYPYYFILADYKGNMLSNYTYTPNGGYSEIYQNLAGEEWFKSLQNSYTETSVMFRQKDFLGKYGLSKFYIAVNIVQDGDRLGILIIGTDEDSIIAQSFSTLSEREMYIVDEEGKCIINFSGTAGLNTKELLSQVKESAQVTGNVKSIQKGNDVIMAAPVVIKGYDADWSLLSVASFRSLTGDAERVEVFNWAIIAFYIFAVLWVLMLLHRNVVKPIKILREAVGEIGNGNLDVKVSRLPMKELGELGDGVNLMVSQLKQQFEDVRRAEENRRIMEFRALQSQIKPHFVRNVLNTIRWLAEINGVSSVSRAVMALSRLLEYNFKDSAIVSTVGEELDYVKTYLYLQKIRFQNKFEDQYFVDEEILNEPFLKLTLQPIVENSIYHGVLKREGLGLVVISCKRQGDNLEVIIRDNGVGMKPEYASQILKPPANTEISDAVDKVEDIALWNIDERIKRKYGEHYGLEIESMPGEGTRVVILIPMEANENDKDSDN